MPIGGLSDVRSINGCVVIVAPTQFEAPLSNPGSDETFSIKATGKTSLPSTTPSSTVVAVMEIEVLPDVIVLYPSWFAEIEKSTSRVAEPLAVSTLTSNPLTGAA